MSGTTFTWTGATSDRDWNTPGNWVNGTIVATSVPNDPSAIAVVDIITPDAIISAGTSDTVASLDVSLLGHVIVGGGTEIGGGGGGALTSIGTITVTSTNTGGGLVGGPAGVITAPAMTIGVGAIIGGGGTFDIGSIVNSGMIQADGSAFELGPLVITGGTISGTGSIEIDGPSTFEVGSAVTQGVVINSAPTEIATLILDDPGTFASSLNLVNADTELSIVLSGTAATGAYLAGDGTSLALTGPDGSQIVPITSNGTFLYQLVGGTGNDTLFGGGTGALIGGAGTNTLVADGPGANMVLTSSGISDLVVVASGNATVSASGTGAQILGSGIGTLTTTVTGGAATVSAGDAATANIVSSGNDGLIFGGTGDFNASVTGTNNTIAGGSGAATINSAGSVLVFGGSGAMEFVGGNGNGAATVVGGAGASEAVTVGAGGMQFSSGDNSTATINGGSGAATIFGGSGATTNYVGSLGGGLFVAGAGNETLNAASSAAPNFFAAGADTTATQLMVGGSGSDTILAGGGVATMTGGASNDSFVYFKAATAGLHDYVTDFTTGDEVYVLGYDSTQSAASLVNNASTSGAGVTLTLSDNTQITFSNLTNANQLNGGIVYG